MTETSRPWSSTTPGDAGPYSADQWSRTWEAVHHAVRPDEGAFIDSRFGFYFALRVQATAVPSSNVEITPGAALVDGTFYENDATYTMAIPANALADPRIDTIVLRKDWVTQTIRLVRLAGTPAVTPVPPVLTTTAGVRWEIPLADIACASGFVTLTNTNIRSRHQWAGMSPNVVLHNITNNSGGTLEDGDVVIWDAGAGYEAVTTSTLGGDPRVAGVWMGRTANGGIGRVVAKGDYVVNMSGVTVAVGDRIEVGTTAKIGRVATGNGNLGRITNNGLADGRPRCYIDVTHPTEDYVLIRDEKTTGTAGGTFTSGAWRTRDLNTEVVDTGNIASVVANQIIMQPGIYEVQWSAPAREVDTHKTRLQDITNTATLIVGTVEDTDAGTGTVIQTRSFGSGRITLTALTTLELQHQCTTTKATNGFGTGAGFSAIEVYSIIEFRKSG